MPIVRVRPYSSPVLVPERSSAPKHRCARHRMAGRFTSGGLHDGIREASGTGLRLAQGSNTRKAYRPLQNRGTLALVNTAPGVSGYTENTNNFAVEQTPAANANGHYFGGNPYVLDGISITSNITTGTANISPNADSLQEIAL